MGRNASYVSGMNATQFTTVFELLADASRWSQRAPARDALRQKVAPYSRKAVAWCLHGAVHFIYGTGTPEHFAAMRKLRAAMEARGITGRTDTFNDSATHAEVLALARAADI